MGHHPKANILAVRKALDVLTVEKDGVDGRSSWPGFGEIADDARFVQATQKEHGRTGIATLTGPATRGGGPFDATPSRASPPACTPTRTRPTQPRPSRRPASCTTRT
ncbi:hypothetical protein [Streptomyces shaanxiensis]